MKQLKIRLLILLATVSVLALCGATPGRAQTKTAKKTKSVPSKEAPGMTGKVKLLTLDPGHFHAALVQKSMYDQIDPVVHVYAPGGFDLDEHLKRIQGYNTRAENPTKWVEQLTTGTGFFEKMIAEKKGNVVVLAGNNAQKTQYILGCVQAGLNVLSDKPMAITPADYELLQQAFDAAKQKNVNIYDIMTERSEITTVMQRELSLAPEVFGTLEKGTPENPAVTKVSVHHFYKVVSGSPLKRPAWYYDVRQQGEGIVDVTTHLVDLVQWECFPEKTLKKADVKMISARRWATAIKPEEFKKSTGLDQFPDALKPDVKDGVLQVYANGEFVYALRGVHAKVSVTWNFEPPAGGGDTHFSMLRGTRASLIIKQGPEQAYKPTLYVEKNAKVSDAAFEKTLQGALAKIAKTYPGIEAKKGQGNWEIVIPEKYKVGHEAHFAQVTERYLKYLATGKLPAWEVPNMLTKYYTTMEAYKMSRK